MLIFFSPIKYKNHSLSSFRIISSISFKVLSFSISSSIYFTSLVLIGVVNPNICIALLFFINFPLIRSRYSATFCLQL